MSDNIAVQIVELLVEGELTRFSAKEETLREIFGDERVADLPVVILCIAGAARKGKSFILNFFLDYLNHKEKHPNEPWQLNENTRLVGFEFQEGDNPTTIGIWAWKHIFVIEQEDGKKVAVALFDSQGTFDNSTSYQDCSTIFGMACIFSSIMCFNVFTDLQEDKLNDFAVFIDHAKMIVDNLGGSGKLFQDLVFILRDFCFELYLKDENGGQKYLEKALGPAKAQDRQQLRDGLNASYERKFGFIFPHPGKKVALEKTSNIAEIENDFVKRAKKMVETLLSQTKMQAKKVGTTEIRCKDIRRYIPLCLKCFYDYRDFAPKAVQEVNRDFMIKLEVEKEVKIYEDEMNNAFVGNERGFQDQKLDEIHQKILDQLQSEVFQRIKNVEIREEIFEQCVDKIKILFVGHKEKNALLVERENNRLKMIDQMRRHDAELETQREYAENLESEIEQQRAQVRVMELEAEHQRERAEAAKKADERMNQIAAQHRQAQAELQRQHEKKQAEIQQQNEMRLQNWIKEVEEQREKDRQQHEAQLRYWQNRSPSCVIS